MHLVKFSDKDEPVVSVEMVSLPWSTTTFWNCVQAVLYLINMKRKTYQPIEGNVFADS